MRILFTGASSFSGYWFVQELSQAGHEVVAVFTKNREEYSGVRGQRVEKLMGVCTPVFECTFGSEAFFGVLQTFGPFDLFCHHAADVTNYKSQDFDIARAVASNTRNLKQVFDGLEVSRCKKIVMTGSVFEQFEGAGPDLWKAFSPYGLSKGFTADIFRYHASQRGFKLGKFVIPNPFGPYEDPRFTTYLMQNWAEGKTPAVNTPSYLRDNIHVGLLAKAYSYFIEKLNDAPGYEKLNPSGYVETQGDFTKRFASEMQKRLSIPCKVDIKVQTQFSEPQMRINTDAATLLPIEWNEQAAWDELADYYQSAFNIHAGALQ